MNGCKVRKVINFISIFGYLLAVELLLVAAKSDAECLETRCGISGQPLIKFPFRLKNRKPTQCGYEQGFELSCSDSNQTTIDIPEFGNSYTTLLVREIDYKRQIVYLDRTDSYGQYNKLYNFSVFPFSIPDVFSVEATIFSCSSNCEYISYLNEVYWLGDQYYFPDAYRDKEVGELYALLAECNCMRISINGLFVTQIGPSFHMEWSKPDCRKCEAKGQRCRLSKYGDADKIECFGSIEVYVIITCAVTGFLVLMLVVGAFCFVYSLDRNEKENRQRIRNFLEDYYAFKPSRYAFSDIKKITNNFEENLGQGAYGTVFKGKLSNDLLVAVKILNNSNKNGEEFINEMATMGLIHHVNVVRLVGYCAEGLRRALIYEFLPNNSLEKFIALRVSRSNTSLSWETLQNIALGIAKGMEYLHQGCDQRILHFDIKPHNILLDRNFVPKISDFGLAKLCSKDQSAVSMNTARGTIGYIAPEVLSRNFGAVSHKSDVYSFGMVLLEMVGGRKNTRVGTRDDDIEEVYYPEWIYNLLDEGEDLRIVIKEEDSAKIAKKLAMVGLWCIQWHPIGRPTMRAVVRMLEGRLEELTMPPNPFASASSSAVNTTMLGRRKTPELEAIAE